MREMWQSKYKKYHLLGTDVFLFILFLSIMQTGITAYAKEISESRIIRVGFLETPGINEIDEHGNHVGLLPDYLNEIAKYTNWNYEYVYTTGDTYLDEFLAGNFDILGETYYSPFLEKYFSYPEYPMGNSYASLLCLKGDNSIKSYDLTSLNGKIIGVFDKAEDKISYLQDFLQIHKLDCELKYYTHEQLSPDGDLYSYLKNGEVDLLLGNTTEQDPDLRTAATFNAQPYYIVTQKDDTETLNELNMALENILDSDPMFQERQYEKNFHDIQYATIQFNENELEYIREKKEVSVAVVKDGHPFFCIVDSVDQHEGILPDLFQKITEYTGLTFNYIYSDNYKEAVELLKSGKADLLGTYMDGEYSAQKNGFILSSPYITMNNIVVRNKTVKYPSDNLTAGVLKGRRLPDSVEAGDIQTYDTPKDALDDLNQGKIDLFYGLAPAIEQEMQRHRYVNVVPITRINYNTDVQFAMLPPVNVNLLTLLNKSIAMLSTKEKNTILDRNLISMGYSSLSLKDLFFANPTIFFVIFCIILLLIVSGCIFLMQSRMKNKLMQSNLEKAELKSQAKSNFLSQMSHEIRTPMNAIVGLTDLVLLDGRMSDSVAEKVRKIRISSEYMMVLINDILDMSKIENGKLKLQPELLSLERLIHEIEEMMGSQAEQNDLHLQVNCEIRNDWLYGDSIRLRQVLNNLLSNACKFTPPGGEIYLSVRETKTKGDTGIYDFSVKDTGVGIDKESQSQIFEAFEQLGTNTSQSRGTGLGLPISAHIVQAMGGELKVYSIPGQGSEFYFTVNLPFGEQPEAKTVMDHEKNLSDLDGVCILLVEDNMLNAEIVRELLRMEGANVEWAHDGKEALDLFEGSNPGSCQIILMDVQMPVMNGIETAKAIRSSLHPDAKTIPIIAMAANSFKEDIETAYAAGMNGFISKPIDIQYMNQVIHQYL